VGNGSWHGVSCSRVFRGDLALHPVAVDNGLIAEE